MKVLKSLVFVCGLLHTILSMPNVQDEWQTWKKKYGKSYFGADEKIHLEIWKENYKYVWDHNAQTDKEFVLEMNHLADQKLEKPSIDIEMYKWENEIETGSLKFIPQIPQSWDWRTKGAIGPVHSQGQLGDAQSIVAAECVQSYTEIKTGQLVDVSIIEVNDCCVKQRMWNPDIFQCIREIGGLCSSASYPQSAGTCRNNTCSPVAQVNGGRTVQSGDEIALKAAVYKMPVMTLVDASHPSFQLYRSGIYSEPKCSKTIGLDHVLQIVGYGSMNGTDCWICKNSWGTSWGDNGYIYIARNKGNMCGIATAAQYPE